jgi:hypothetical protein
MRLKRRTASLQITAAAHEHHLQKNQMDHYFIGQHYAGVSIKGD